MSTADLLLPGQPLPARFNSTPTPQPGSGCYLSPNGKLVASIVGVPVRDGSVGGPEELRCRSSEAESKLTFCWSAKIVSVKSRHEMSAVPEIGAIVSTRNSRYIHTVRSLETLKLSSSFCYYQVIGTVSTPTTSPFELNPLTVAPTSSFLLHPPPDIPSNTPPSKPDHLPRLIPPDSAITRRFPGSHQALRRPAYRKGQVEDGRVFQVGGRRPGRGGESQAQMIPSSNMRESSE